PLLRDVGIRARRAVPDQRAEDGPPARPRAASPAGRGGESEASGSGAGSPSLIRLVRHCLLLGVAVWAVNAQWTYRVPGSAASAFLPWLGTGLSLLTLFLIVGGLIRRLPAEDRVRRFLHKLERVVTFLVLGF